MTFRLRVGVVSDVGLFREDNQDAAFAASWGAGVADGVGGGPAGDLASAAFVHRLVAGGAGMADADTFSMRVRGANWDIGAHVRRDPDLAGMATTFTGLWLDGHDGLLLAHTGDSRAYLLREDALVRQTRDDSYVQGLVDRGLVSPAEAMNHPRRNIITASLRGDAGDLVNVVQHAPRRGDRWLLCSDGVSDYLPDDEIHAVLGAPTDPSAAAAALVSVALEAGSRDNVTAVVCDVDQGVRGAEQPVWAGAAAVRFTERLAG